MPLIRIITVAPTPTLALTLGTRNMSGIVRPGTDCLGRKQDLKMLYPVGGWKEDSGG